MKNSEFKKLLTSIKQAGEIKKGTRLATRTFVDVSEIRHQMGLTQHEFAHLIHISGKNLTKLGAIQAYSSRSSTILSYHH